MKELTQFIEDKLVLVSWGDYNGIREPSLTDLCTLKAMAEIAIAEKLKEQGHA